MKKGDEIVFFGDSADISTVRTGTFVSPIDKYHSTVLVDGVESYAFSGAIYPIEFRDELEKIVEHRMELKRAYEDSIKLIYQLNNKLKG
jgi:hypothetical protein